MKPRAGIDGLTPRACRSNAIVTGGREGRAVSTDNVLDLKLTVAREMGGAGEAGTNPEQLFAAGYSACFLGALKYVAGQQKLTLPPTAPIEGSAGIGQIPTGFGIAVELKISVPGLPREQVETLVQKAHIVHGGSAHKLKHYVRTVVAGLALNHVGQMMTLEGVLLVELLSRFEDFAKVSARPRTERFHGFPQSAAELGQLIIHTLRSGREHSPRDEAVPLQSTQCEREHPLRDTADHPFDFVEALRTIAEQDDD
jgi:osmotically inducible protein OsmC